MEYILNSNEHKIKNNCLKYNFQKPIRFENQYISLTSMIFYNYFENITDKFKLVIKNKIQSYTINFTNGSYYASVNGKRHKMMNLTIRLKALNETISFVKS